MIKRAPAVASDSQAKVSNRLRNGNACNKGGPPEKFWIFIGVSIRCDSKPALDEDLFSDPHLKTVG